MDPVAKSWDPFLGRHRRIIVADAAATAGAAGTVPIRRSVLLLGLVVPVESVIIPIYYQVKALGWLEALPALVVL